MTKSILDFVDKGDEQFSQPLLFKLLGAEQNLTKMSAEEAKNAKQKAAASNVQ